MEKYPFASIPNYFVMIASLRIPTYSIRAYAQVRDNQARSSNAIQEIFVISLWATVTYVAHSFTMLIFYADKTLFLINGINIALNLYRCGCRIL